MNYYQFLAFGLFVLATAIYGVALYGWLNPKKEAQLNQTIYFGEVFLLGAIVTIGSMLFLSVIGLYKGYLLWAVSLYPFIFLSFKGVRNDLSEFISRCRFKNITDVLFFGLIGFFLFRNCFFLVDVDSHSTYLFAQKLWLHYGTSVLPYLGVDIRTFTPHFNAVPYALGIALFGEETLFAQLVVAFWTVIVLLLVYGYTKYRLGGWFALAAALFVLLDDHMFYSGANVCCIINSALVAFIFAAAYNFWESRKKASPFRFVLALIFLLQLIANKYQAIYSTFFILILGVLVQEGLVEKIKLIWSNKKWLGAVVTALLITALWYFKNWLATGCPTFPMLAGTFGALQWTVERQDSFLHGSGKLGLQTVLKYLSYFFIWHGVVASKYLWVCIVFLPLLMTRFLLRTTRNFDQQRFFEVCFWLGLSILLTIGMVLTNFAEPRVYRYNIAVLSFSLVFVLAYFLHDCWGIPKKIVIGIVLILSLSGHRMFLYQGGMFQTPTIQDNITVLTNRLHMAQMIERYFPKVLVVRNQYDRYKARIEKSAWDMGANGFSAMGVSAFLLPVMPHVDIWHTSIVRWDSYQNVGEIVKDLRAYGLEQIVYVDDHEQTLFLSLEDYAKKAVREERRPQKIFYDYGFPKELTTLKW